MYIRRKGKGQVEYVKVNGGKRNIYHKRKGRLVKVKTEKIAGYDFFKKLPPRLRESTLRHISRGLK